jgi:hypothetical protein
MTNMLYREMIYCSVLNRIQLFVHYVKIGAISGDMLNGEPTDAEFHAIRNS